MHFVTSAPRGRARSRGTPIACLIVMLAGVIAFSAPLLAAESPLTLGLAQRIALERSRQITSLDLAATASREMAAAAGERPDPVVRLGVDNLPVDGSDRFSLTRDFMTMRRIGVMQEFTRPEKLRLRAQRFEIEAEKSGAEKSAAVAAIQRDTALAWLDRHYAEAMAQVVFEQAAEGRLEIEAADSAYRAGRGNQADTLAARAALVTLDDRASELNRRIRAAKTRLARWVGEAAERPLAGRPAVDSIPLGTRVSEHQLAHHPEIMALARQVEIASTEAKIAQANKKPDWSVELMYSQRGSAFSNMVSIGVSVPWQWDQKNRQEREVASKLAMAEQARAQLDDMLQAHVAEVQTMVSEWENDRERLRRHESQLIPIARERTQAMLAGYRGNKASLSDVLAARRGEIDARMQALQLEWDAARLWAQLNFLVPEGAEKAYPSSPSSTGPIKESK